MFSGNFFGLGAILPFLSLLLGYVVVGVIVSVTAVVATLRANAMPVVQLSRQSMYWSIGVLVCSEISTVVGACLIHSELDLGLMLIRVGFLFLWPVSAALAIWERGVARKTLLVGHGIIAAWTCIMLLSIVVHKLDGAK
jgi:hypothetical protein